ncbi:hypothetical protein [Streptomyces sp. NBC_00582]|uniref:hypothetical protein n=1 Tax=Streptomyces sp. NBC_00582 TaxID=2975783 RepID=UPI002E804CF0|nr:hypothetical protein [Streptomyces sp. NBC_00582]WUB58979.1 hypothetical protein OG852_00165 [Streptomyces sp. NBC_00582]WUB67748.1 hypothetical protein OG852_48970 [Streptomyces sp. NBC_00582]
MTTRSTPPQPFAGAYVDAPAIHRERLSPQQIAGRSCCWCSGTPDPRFPVPILRGATLFACDPCASMYGVPAVEAD